MCQWYMTEVLFLWRLSFLVVDTRSVGTTIAVGQNMQICHSLRCKQNQQFNVRPTDTDFPK